MSSLTPEQIERGRASVAAGPQTAERSPLHDVPIATLHQLAEHRLNQVADILDQGDIRMKRLLFRFIEDANELLDEVRQATED